MTLDRSSAFVMDYITHEEPLNTDGDVSNFNCIQCDIIRTVSVFMIYGRKVRKLQLKCGRNQVYHFHT
jgi:hypothetical protein